MSTVMADVVIKDALFAEYYGKFRASGSKDIHVIYSDKLSYGKIWAAYKKQSIYCFCAAALGTVTIIGIFFAFPLVIYAVLTGNKAKNNLRAIDDAYRTYCADVGLTPI